MDSIGCRIEKMLCELAEATKINGEIWRAAYTKEDHIAKKLLSSWMQEAGLLVRQDSLGNLYGRLEGLEASTLLIGSHLDTVKDGGKYDGALGVITGLAVLSQLKAENVKLVKSLEVVGLVEEEGSRYNLGYLGSKAIAGKLEPQDLQTVDGAGILLQDAISAAGCDPDHFHSCMRPDLCGYVELHIEQGPVLQQLGKKIGIVEHIVGIKVWQIRLLGRQNHAGTTPMKMRLDPVTAFASLVSHMTAYAQSVSETATMTFGKVEVLPGMSNVIPGSVIFTAEIRDGSRAGMDEIDCELQAQLKRLENIGFQVQLELHCNEQPAALNRAMVQRAAAAAQEEGLEFIHMNSGAGHDAQVMTSMVPACMMFIPSKDGISHNPYEYSSPKDMEAGYRTLLRLVRSLADNFISVH